MSIWGLSKVRTNLRWVLPRDAGLFHSDKTSEIRYILNVWLYTTLIRLTRVPHCPKHTKRETNGSLQALSEIGEVAWVPPTV